MLDIFKVFKIFNKKEPQTNQDIQEPDLVIKTFQDEIDYSEIEEPKIVGNVDSNKTLMIVDDIIESYELYSSDISFIKTKMNFDIMQEYKIILCLGIDAGYIAMKYIQDHLINYAILDITLGTSKRLKTGDLIQLDGIDIAIELLDKYNTKLKFCTAHTMDVKNIFMKKIMDKFNDALSLDINDYYMDKNGDRYIDILDLLEYSQHKYTK